MEIPFALASKTHASGSWFFLPEPFVNRFDNLVDGLGACLAEAFVDPQDRSYLGRGSGPFCPPFFPSDEKLGLQPRPSQLRPPARPHLDACLEPYS
jgi:hypothetical protein